MAWGVLPRESGDLVGFRGDYYKIPASAGKWRREARMDLQDPLSLLSRVSGNRAGDRLRGERRWNTIVQDSTE